MFEFLEKLHWTDRATRTHANRRRRAARRATLLRLEQLEPRNLLAAVPDGLVSWYRAEGDATDFAGGNDGVLENGATFTAGKVGQAFLFDGVDDQIRIDDDNSQDPASGFTVEAWVNLSESGHGRTIAQKRSAGNVGGYTFETSHDIGVNGLQFVLWFGGGAHFLRTPAGVLTNGVWHHVAATYNGMAMRIFVDGVEQASDSASGPVDDSDEDVIIGRNAVIGSFAWKGAIDEWSFYNRGLTQAEIQTIVAAGTAGKQAAIVVNTTADTIDADAGVTSLREAINFANANPGQDTIAFEIPGEGPHTISPQSALPTITDAVAIDGYTQPGAAPNTLTGDNDAVILIELDGSLAGDGASGLVLSGGSSTVRGLAINRFGERGIELRSGDNVIEGNFLGTDVTGTQDLGNHEGVTIIRPEEIEPLYSNDFESGAGDGEDWSFGHTEVTPVDSRRFLGQFDSETVTLTLNADAIDQDITLITVAFDLFVIRTWDGNHAALGSGPDRFTLTLGDGTTLADTTFSNGHPSSAAAGQAFPGSFGTGQFDSRTDAAENNTLGFTSPGVDVMDSVYRLSYTFPYTGGDLVLNFTGALTSALDDESWGLDNVMLIEGEPPASVQGNRIGGTLPAEQNIIAYSSGDGIRTDGDDIAAVIVGNSIFANAADGIDFDDQIVDEPEILALTSFPGELKFEGSLDAEPSTTYRIEMFASDGAIESNNNEGQWLLGVRQVTTDAGGHISFIHELPPVADGQWITATATLIDGDGETLLATSEFSEAVQVNSVTLADLEVTISDLPDPVLIRDSVTYLVSVINHGPADATGVVVVAHGQAGQPFNNVTLPVGGLASGASSSFQLTFTPTVIGTFSVSATVNAGEDDPDPANNSFTATTQVVPRAKFELGQANYEVREGEAFAVLTVRRIGDLEGGGSVEFNTINGSAGQRGIRAGLSRIDDFTTTSGTLFFRSRSNVATIRVPIGDDDAIESDETFRVVLSNPSAGAELGAISSAVVVIHDNDPTVSFFASSSQRNESVTGRGSIEVRLTPASNQTVTVAYAAGSGGTATPGVDYGVVGRTLTFRPGETRKFINFTTVNDTVYEGNEFGFVELSSPTNAFLGSPSRHRITIVDNDPQPPPQEPGSTIETALFIDLQTRPRQAFRDLLVRINATAGDIDTFRVHLDAGEAVALDVDPDGNPAFFLAGLSNSTLTVLGSDGVTPDIRQLASIGPSAEPDTGVVNNNPAHLFRAPATGDYYFQLQANANGFFGYRLHFHRLGVSENVPAPELLNVPGAMFAWFQPSATPGIATVGITGPTGYGFTLEGPWQQQVSGGRSILKSQTLTLPSGSRFTLHSREGFDVPLLANGPIVISTKSQRWGAFVGEVVGNAINLPVGLDIAPINDLIADALGSQIAAVGLLTGNWRISLGGKVLAVSTSRGLTNVNSPIDQLLDGVPYLRQKGPINVTAHLGPISVSYPVVEKPVDWAFDPADPMLYLKGEKVGQARQPALAVSLHGLLEYKPQDAPNPLVNPGVTQFYGHIYGAAIIPIKIGPVPVDVDAEVVLNVDADRDGRPLGDLRDVADVFDVLQGDFSEVREIVSDIQLGANGIAIATIPKSFAGAELEMEAGRASVVLNGLTETIWVRGQQGGKAFPSSPIEVGGASVVYEGLIDFASGEFLYSATTSSNTAGVVLAYNFTITHESISVSITGRAEWSASINYGVGTVSGKAIAEITANVEITIDDDGDVRLGGSITASGKLRYQGTNLFSGSIEASVRSRGFRFRFPRGVGSIDLPLFD